LGSREAVLWEEMETKALALAAVVVVEARQEGI